ncbi:MAG: R3H domain-containing nucleic acid-binding protein [Acidobacteriota bacterium]
MQRQFFSGNSIEQAVMSAARHYKVDPDVLAYTIRDKKHGFLNIRRRVVIEVNPERLEKVEAESLPQESHSDGASESVQEAESSAENTGSAEKAGAESTGVDAAEADTGLEEAATEGSGEVAEASGARDGSGSEEVAEESAPAEEAVTAEEAGRPRSRRGRRGSQKARARREDVTVEEFSWDPENDGWEEEDLEDEDDSREIIAIEMCLERILDVMDLEIEYAIAEGETMEIEFSGEDSEYLVEEDGKVLKAIEHIVPRMARALVGRSISVHVDCNGFRANHEENLRNAALEIAEEVMRRGRSKTMSPMNPADRRIVHLALVDHSEVDTISQGHGFMKRVKIVLAD